MDDYNLIGESEKEGIFINGIKYLYSINKLNKEEGSLIIKLYNSNNKEDIFFTYEAGIQKLIKDIKFLSSFENLDEMITSLRAIFSYGNAKVEVNHEEYKLILNLTLTGIPKKYFVQLTKHESVKPKNESKDKFEELENKYNDLLKQFEKLKIIREKEIRNIVKEIFFDGEIKMKLFEEMEQLFLSKYNLNNINKNKVNKIEDDMVNEVQNIMNNKDEKINNEITSIQKQLKDNIEYFNDIKSNIKNYILIEVKIDENNLNKDIRLLNQVSINNNFCNFEKDDIKIIIDDQIIPLKYKNYNKDSEYDDKPINHENSQELEYNSNIINEYYWNFSEIGKHTVEIIFKKKLLQGNDLFKNCDSIFQIDCSNFDCSEIINCANMFENCTSLIEINFGKIDFPLSKDFSYMFHNCQNLEKLDVSNFNTENSKSFKRMFSGCSKLKEINVSGFQTANCENIEKMFYDCNSLESIDMSNWDMENIKQLGMLFHNCLNLKVKPEKEYDDSQEESFNHYESQLINLSLNQNLSSSQNFLENNSIEDENSEEKMNKDPNASLSLDQMIKEYKDYFLYIFDFLEFKDQIQFSGIHKGFNIERIYLLNTKREVAIASLELKESETLDDRIKKFELNNPPEEYNKPFDNFNVSRYSKSAVLNLDKAKFSELFQEKFLDIKFNDIYIIYRILFILIKETKIGEIEDDVEFWQKCTEYLNFNGKGKIGSFILEKSKDFDFSHKSIYLLNKLLVGKKKKIRPSFFSQISGTTGFLSFIITDALEFCGVLISQKTPKSRIYDNLIFYKNIIDHLTDFIDFLSKINIQN